MAGLLDLFGGGGGSADDPYADILTPAQRRQMQTQGLLAMAGAFAEAGMPSRLPIPFGAALGKAAAALGTGSEAGMKAAIENALAAQKVRDLRSLADYRKTTLGGINDPTSPLNRAIEQILRPTGTTPTPGPSSPGGGTPPAGTYPGSGSGASPAGGGGLLSPDFALGSDYASGVTAPQPGGVGRFAGGSLLDYPEARGGLSVGGGLLGSEFDPGLGLATPSARYAPGGDLDPLAASAQRGLVGMAGGTPAAPATPSATNAQAYGVVTPEEREAWIKSREAGGQDTIQAFVMKYRLRPRTTEGSGGGAPPAEAPGAGEDTAEPVAAAPSGGGLLALASDLRAPVEADPFRRVDAVLAQIRQRESGGNYAIPPERNVDFPRSHASGGHQFQPGTWREWTQRSGYGTEYPEAYRAPPQVQDAVARYAALHGDVNAMNLWGASAGNRPYPSPFEGGGGPPDEVIPTGSGSGARPPVTLAQYAAPGAGGAPMPAAPGGAAVPGMPQLAPPTQLAAPDVPGLPGPPAQGQGVPQAGAADPRLNALILELARQNAASEVLGLGNPYASLLTVLQGSPQYKAAVESATTAARIAQEEPSKMRTDAAKARLDMIQQMAKDGLTLDKDNNPVEIPGMREMLGRTAGEVERAKQQATSQFQLTDARVIGPDGQPTTTKMPVYEYIFRQQQSVRNASMGAKPQPGDIVSSPISGPPPEGFEYRMDPNGRLTAEPIHGTPAEQVVKDRERKQAVSDQATLVSRDIMVQNANRVEDLVQNSSLPVTGTAGPFLSRIGGTAANDVRVMIETMKARSSLDQLNQMRNSNPTGAGLGNVSNAEGDRLAAAIANLDQSQTQDQFLFNLRRLKQEYVDIVHGPGTYSKLSDEPVLKVPSMPSSNQPIDRATYDKLPSGSPFTAPDGSRRIKP